MLGQCISSLRVREVKVSLVCDGDILPFVFSKNKTCTGSLKPTVDVSALPAP